MTRLRDLGITIGEFPTGPFNAITDVKDVLVGHTTIILEEPRIARTGVTIIMPRRGDVWRNPAFAAYHSFNGCGEMTGLLWVEESGQLSHPIALTSTHHVGTVHEALVAYAQEHGHTEHSSLPVVAETWDGWLNDMDGFHLKARHVYAALGGLDGGPVAEGNVGGGTGMICHEFKGGIGTSSRVVETKSGAYTVGALVQANHGSREDFRVGGVPVGRLIDPSETPVPWPEPAESSSIIIVVATDAPLLPFQCRRLAKRATVGFARAGGVGHNGSGDIFLAFATGNELGEASSLRSLHMVPNQHLNAMFVAAAEAVEEAIINAVVAAETMTGWQGRTVYGLPTEELVQIMADYPTVGRRLPRAPHHQ
ncbi:MAG: P1 family peptidase [Anaerolineae bacterium]|nr:P1 family peptidase [Anaerolineales bacterium]MCB8936163.1 P1 family peptidase [Promineifilum sp.]MCW5846122.1 P1 family peptidase [Anaerolineae bacterium]